MLGVILQWTSIPSRELHATETEISTGLMGYLARMQTLPLTMPAYIFSVELHSSCGAVFSTR